MRPLADLVALAVLSLEGWRRRWVRTSVGRVHVLDVDGSGPLPPVVLLHGFSAAGVHYLPLVRELRPRVRRLILPDLPAHGFSDVPPAAASPAVLQRGLVEALDAVLDRPAALFGNSMGGFAAIRYTLARPERVLGLILCSPSGAAMDAEELVRWLATFHLEGHADALAFVDRLLTRPSRLRQIYAWGIRKRFGAPEMRALLASVSPGDLLLPEELWALAPPILMLWGQRDRILPADHLSFFRRCLPAHAEIEEPPLFGHSPFLEDPGALARRMERFLAALG